MRRFGSLLVNNLIAFFVFAAALRMLYRFNEQGLPASLIVQNLQYLKYFTVLSNLLGGVAAIIYGAALTLRLCRVIRRVPGWVTRLKYVSTTLLALTFMVALCYIGPRTDFQSAYRGANFWFHLIVPILAVLDFTLLDRSGRLTLPATFLPLIPTAVYSGFYLANLIMNGYGGRDHPNDWYGFGDDGAAGVYIVLAALLVGSWALAWALRLTRRGKDK